MSKVVVAIGELSDQNLRSLGPELLSFACKGRSRRCVCRNSPILQLVRALACAANLIDQNYEDLDLEKLGMASNTSFENGRIGSGISEKALYHWRHNAGAKVCCYAHSYRAEIQLELALEGAGSKVVTRYQSQLLGGILWYKCTTNHLCMQWTCTT